MKKVFVKRSFSFVIMLVTAAAVNTGTFPAQLLPGTGLTVNAVEDQDYLYDELTDGTIKITSYNGEDETVVIPSEISGKTVTQIGDRAFQGRVNIKSVQFPDTLLSIGEGSFYGCSGLSSVNIPGSVKSIGDNAFSYCQELEKITIPKGETELGSWVFQNSKWMNEQPDGCVYLGEDDFILYTYKGVMPENTSVKIKDGTEYIAGAAFTFVAGDMVTSYEQLVSVELPSGLKSIGTRAFQECRNLSDVKMPDSVTKIANLAFSWDQPWIKKYADGPVYLGKVLFFYKGDKSDLTSFEIKPGTVSIGDDAFRGSEKLESITIPDSVTSIGDGVFNECGSLTSVEIPDGVENIGNQAFLCCQSLKTVSLPKSLKSIGISVFNCCDNLKDIFYNGTEDSFSRIIMQSDDRDQIVALLKYQSGDEEISGSDSQQPESSEEKDEHISAAVQSSSEQRSDTVSEITEDNTDDQKSEKTFENVSENENNNNTDKNVLIICIIALLLIAGIIITVIVIGKNKSGK